MCDRIFKIAILAFLLTRLVLNISPDPLFISFAIIYLILIVLFFKAPKTFTPIFVIFLIIDSIVGWYISNSMNNFGLEFYGTLTVNLLIIWAEIYRHKITKCPNGSKS